MSRTGRMSTWLPGRNATAPLRSTVKPPLTRPKIWPVTRSLAWKLFSSRVHASSRRAFSRDSEASPFLSSIRSRNTSTVSPTWSSGATPPTPNSFERHAALRFEADIDQGGVVLDRDDPPLDDGAFEPVGADAKRLVKHRGKTFLRAEFGGFCCYGHSVSSIPDITSGSAGIAAERAAGRKRVRLHRPGPGDRQERLAPSRARPAATVLGGYPRWAARARAIISAACSST